MKRFYVYEWFIVDTDEIFYVGKGTGKRKTQISNRNEYFKSVYNKYKCEVRIVLDNLTNEEACQEEIKRIAELKQINQAKCNFTNGGTGWSTGDLNPTVINPHYGDTNGMRTKNIDFFGENNPFYGKHHTDETKKKISKNRKGKGAQYGANNPMFEKGYLITGEKNGMYNKKGIEAPNAILFNIFYLDGTSEVLTSKQCEKKFGIAFNRIRSEDEGILCYKKKTPNSIYEGTKIKCLNKEEI